MTEAQAVQGDDLPPRTPTEDGAAAFANHKEEWEALWRGVGAAPVPRCFWTSRDDVLAWLAAHDTAWITARELFRDACKKPAQAMRAA